MDSLLFFSLFNFCIISSFLVHCVISSEDFKLPIFSTKTPYFWGRDIDEHVEEDKETWIQFENRECQIIHLNAVIRHGSRYPTLSWTKKMTSLGEKLKNDEKVLKRKPLIKSWENPFPESHAGLLSELGEDEQWTLGRRFRKRFSLLFDGDVNNIVFGVTYKPRTKSSFKAFFEGLTDHDSEEDPIQKVKPTVNDKHLRFYDACSKYTNSVENNKTAAPEHSSFKNGPQMQQVASKIASKLGVPTLSSEEAMTIHHICAFELAMFDDSDWCDLLDSEDLLTFEYLYDLKQYWRRGYGHSVNWGMTCPFVSYLFQQLTEMVKKAEINEDFPVASIQFAHAETIIPLYAAFGLFNDTLPLKATDFGKRDDRLFKTSQIVPMSANLGIGLYQCEASEQDLQETYVIRMFVNEMPVVIPACGKETCELSDFVKYYEKFVNCNYSEICENEKNKSHDEL